MPSLGLQNQTRLSNWRTKGNHILSNFECCLSSSCTCHSSTFNIGIHHALQASQTWDPQHFCVSNVRYETSRFSKDLLHPHHTGRLDAIRVGFTGWGVAMIPGLSLLTAEMWKEGGDPQENGYWLQTTATGLMVALAGLGAAVVSWEEDLRVLRVVWFEQICLGGSNTCSSSPVQACPPPLCPHLPQGHTAHLAGYAENCWLRVGISKHAYWCIECFYHRRVLGFVKCFLSTVVPLWAHCCLVAQSCPSLCDPTDSSPPGSYVHGILQARILEWVAISFCRESSRPRDWTQVSCTGEQVSCTGGFFTFYATRETLLKHNWGN